MIFAWRLFNLKMTHFVFCFVIIERAGGRTVVRKSRGEVIVALVMGFVNQHAY